MSSSSQRPPSPVFKGSKAKFFEERGMKNNHINQGLYNDWRSATRRLCKKYEAKDRDEKELKEVHEAIAAETNLPVKYAAWLLKTHMNNTRGIKSSGGDKSPAPEDLSAPESPASASSVKQSSPPASYDTTSQKEHQPSLSSSPLPHPQIPPTQSRESPDYWATVMPKDA